MRASAASLVTHLRHMPQVYWLVIALTILHIVPVWAFKYFPSQDGPSHLENSYVLAHYFDKGRVYSEFYDLNLTPVPNWLSHVTLALLMQVVPPLASEKVLLTAYIVCFVASIVYLLRSVAPGKHWLALVAVPFVYNYLLHSGFYNFVMSLPLMLLTLGYWWRRRSRRIDWRMGIGLNLLLALVYFASILTQLLTILALLVLALVSDRGRVRRAALLAASIVPALALALSYLVRGAGEPAGRLAAGVRWRYLATIGSLASYDSREYYLGAALAAVFAVAIAFAVLARLGVGKIGSRGAGLRDPEPHDSPHERRDGPARRFPLPEDGFMLLAVVFALLYFFAPLRAFGGGAITYRLGLYPFLAILPWLGGGMPRAARHLIGAAAVAIALVHFGITVHYYQVFNRGLEEFTSGVPLIEENATILPISFDHKGEAARIGVYRHAASYYCLSGGAIDLANYEGAKTYFPIKYKSSLDPFAIMGTIESQRGNIWPQKYPARIDYVLLWAAPVEFPCLSWIEKNYELIHSEGRLKLYRRTR